MCTHVAAKAGCLPAVALGYMQVVDERLVLDNTSHGGTRSKQSMSLTVSVDQLLKHGTRLLADFPGVNVVRAYLVHVCSATKP